MSGSTPLALRRLAALGAVALLGLAACGSDDTDTSAASAPAATPAATGAPAVSDAPMSSDEPTTMKIVSLSPSATEMLFAIGAGPDVIAVDDQSNFPDEALAVQTDLSGYTPNVEAIAKYEPDLVIHDGTTDLGTQLQAIGIADWVGAAPVDFDDIYVQIEQLGAATGHVAEADELVAQMRADIDAAVASVATPATPLRFYHELDDTLYSITSNTFIGQVYGLFGLQNIADTTEGTSDYPQLSPEFVISQSPDLIFLADTKCCGQSPATVAARAGWGVVSAVTNGGVVSMDDDVASRWGPRIVDYVQQVAAAVNGVTVAAP
ncbi:MAG: ABC transporter substrate-binding protein [Ilumatobacteraceae bacterium]